MNKTIAVLATLDTKGPEGQYLREQIEACGENALLIDTGVVGESSVKADITREEIAKKFLEFIKNRLRNLFQEVQYVLVWHRSSYD